MANAALDANSKQTAIARLNSDGVTIIRLKANASDGSLMTDDGTTGTASSSHFSATDANGRTTLFAVSSTDGVTLIPLLATSAGSLLIDSH